MGWKLLSSETDEWFHGRYLPPHGKAKRLAVSHKATLFQDCQIHTEKMLNKFIFVVTKTTKKKLKTKL